MVMKRIKLHNVVYECILICTYLRMYVLTYLLCMYVLVISCPGVLKQKYSVFSAVAHLDRI